MTIAEYDHEVEGEVIKLIHGEYPAVRWTCGGCNEDTATIFEPDLCGYQQATVILEQIVGQARTAWQPGGPDAPHEVAITVDVDRYFQHFFNVVG